MITTEVLTNDIPLSIAIGAHSGTSMTPERRGDSERAEYAQTLFADYERLKLNAERGGTLGILESEFAEYRAGYRQRYLKHLNARSRCMSSMITGPSNFPVRRNQKRSDIADRRYTELTEFRERALKAILRVLRPDLRPIMSGDSDAIERLREELEKLEALQARMRAANKVVKSKKLSNEQKIAALVEQKLPASAAAELLKPDFAGRTGFADYQLSNNSANIRRIKQRIETLSVVKATADTEVENVETGIRVEDAPADNRVRIFFPGKPEVDVRDRLTANGYRWAPSLGCWQAYRNYRSQEFAKQFAEAAA